MAREKEVKIAEGSVIDARETVREYDAKNDVLREVIREIKQLSVGKSNFRSTKFESQTLVEF